MHLISESRKYFHECKTDMPKMIVKEFILCKSEFDFKFRKRLEILSLQMAECRESRSTGYKHDKWGTGKIKTVETMIIRTDTVLKNTNLECLPEWTEYYKEYF